MRRVRQLARLNVLRGVQARKIGDRPNIWVANGTQRLHEGNVPDPAACAAPIDKDGLVLQTRTGITRVLVWNRPEVSNATNYRLARNFLREIKNLNNYPMVRAFLLKGKGSESYSIGVDLNEVREALENKNVEQVVKTLREHYKLSYYIATCETPTVTLLTGKLTDGGCAMGSLSDYSLANYGTLVAFPAAAYGYIPDGGASYLLSRANAKNPGLGTYLAMTGHALIGADALHAGFAQYWSSTDVGSYLVERIQVNEQHTREAIDDCIKELLDTPPEPTFTGFLNLIRKCFHDQPTVESIVNALEVERITNIDPVLQKFAAQALASIARMSPLSLKVILKQLQIAETVDLHDCYKLDFRLAYRMVNQPDFAKGLVNFNRLEGFEKVNWTPATLEEVSDQMVNSIFEPLTVTRDGTCDLSLPDELYLEENILAQYSRILKDPQGRIAIVDPRESETQ